MEPSRQPLSLDQQAMARAQSVLIGFNALWPEVPFARTFSKLNCFWSGKTKCWSTVLEPLRFFLRHWLRPSWTRLETSPAQFLPRYRFSGLSLCGSIWKFPRDSSLSCMGVQYSHFRTKTGRLLFVTSSLKKIGVTQRQKEQLTSLWDPSGA